MASPSVVQLTDTNFESEVLASEQPVVVDFWAEWCPPCKALGPIIDALAEEYKGRIKIGKLDTDSSPGTARRFQISSIPAILIFKKGQLVRKMQGFQAKRNFNEVFDSLLAAPAA